MHRYMLSAGLCFMVSVLSITAADIGDVKVGGRIMYDVAGYESDEIESKTGSELRRARIYVKGTLDEDWFYKLQYDFVGDGAEGIRDAYLGYSAISFLDSIRVGNISEYGSLEDSTSSKHIMFMARSLPITTFTPTARRFGVAANAHGEGWHGGAGVFGEHPGIDSEEDDGYGTSARFTLNPVRADRHKVHLGVHGALRAPRGDDTARFRTRPEAHVDSTRLLDTGVISNVNYTASYGVEAAWVLGSLSIEGEYMGVAVDRDEFSTENYGGAYIATSWFLTGESRPYAESYGCFGKLKPLKPFGDGGAGAWSLAARYSTLDLDDDILGGTGDSLTFGVNWYPTSSVRFMLNYSKGTTEREDGDVDVDIVQARAQVVF